MKQYICTQNTIYFLTQGKTYNVINCKEHSQYGLCIIDDNKEHRIFDILKSYLKKIEPKTEIDFLNCFKQNEDSFYE